MHLGVVNIGWNMTVIAKKDAKNDADWNLYCRAPRKAIKLHENIYYGIVPLKMIYFTVANLYVYFIRLTQLPLQNQSF